jgi:hypothetical protein
MNIKYKFYKMLSIFFGVKYLMKYYRKQGMHIGNDTNIFSKIIYNNIIIFLMFCK